MLRSPPSTIAKLFLVLIGLSIPSAILATKDLQHPSFQYNCNLQESDDEIDDRLAVGDRTWLCIHFLPYQVRLAFEVTVDRHVALTARKIFDVLGHRDVDVLSQLANTDWLSPQTVD